MSDEELTGIHFESPERIECLFCGAPIDTANHPPFSTVLCPECGKSFALPVAYGKFVLLELLAVGGMGAVFKGFDPALKRAVAVKVLQRQFGENQEFVAQFEHEAQMLAALNNPNIVQVYAAGNEGGSPFIAMELVDRGRLDSHIKQKGPLDEAFVLRTAVDVARGLRAAAAIGLAHGDVKPGNILYDKTGTAKVVDFGLARFKGESWQPGVIWGTPYFIAPEVVRGKQPNIQADIYSLGCSLYYALAGKFPFDKPKIEDTV
ncbi:MAG TPA: serine/threonine-protein kinase, partial [Kiritimatiellia bacterium]